MGRHYQILFPLLSLFLVRVDLSDLYPLKFNVKVIDIIDADTVLVKSHARLLKVRLLKLDAPEKGQAFLNQKGDAGRYALKCAQGIIQKEQTYQLSISKLDIYGRYLGELDDVSLRLIEGGCSGLYPYTTFDSKNEKGIFLRALKKAQRNKVGLWNYGGFRQPMLWRKFNRRSAPQPSRPRGHRRGTYRPGRKS